MSMVFFLILLYLLNANGVVVPNGYFIAVWGFTIVGLIFYILSAIAKVAANQNK